MTTLPESAATVQAHDALWTEAVAQVSELAQARLSASLHGRVQRGTALVLQHGIFFEEDGHQAHVLASDGQTWYAVNGRCSCEDYEHAPEHICKHRAAWMVYKRAGELLRETMPPVTPGLLEIEPEPTTQGIRAEWLVSIQGKRYIRYAGLLAMAHERGLAHLTADWTFNDATLSLAEATATFADGRTFHEAGDASPDTVTKTVAPHFRRVALTRAKSRVLRDALNIDLVAIEELGEID